MIKVEAKKTIQLLEVFMKMNSNEENEEYKQQLKEIQRQTSQELDQTYDKFLDYNEDPLSESADEQRLEEDADLFKGMDEYTGTQTTFATGQGHKDCRAPFSKYVENAMKRNQLNLSAESRTINWSQEKIKKRDMNKSVENEDLDIDQRYNRSINRTKLSIKPNFFQSTNPGKFFRVRLKPLQGSRDKKKGSIKDLTHPPQVKGENPLSVKKSIHGKNPDYFYEYQFNPGPSASAEPVNVSSTTYIPEEISRNISKPDEKIKNLQSSTVSIPKAVGSKVSFEIWIWC